VIDETAAAGFGAQAGAYERGRPSYPNAAVAWMIDRLEITRGSRVLDLGSGTGKFTRLLVPSGAELLAVEPVPAMREQFRSAVPGIEVLDGTAETLPLPDSSVDAVVCAQAFHWFDADQALREITRVLRPLGGLGLIWNERDESVPWVRELTVITHWDVRMPYRVGTDWRSVLDASGLLEPSEKRQFPYEQELDVEGLVDRVSSVSYLAAMSAEERAPYLDRVRELVDGFPRPFVLPYVTSTYTCRRLLPS
jgi:SAM-dependent methyltransferase